MMTSRRPWAMSPVTSDGKHCNCRHFKKSSNNNRCARLINKQKICDNVNEDHESIPDDPSILFWCLTVEKQITNGNKQHCIHCTDKKCSNTLQHTKTVHTDKHICTITHNGMVSRTRVKQTKWNQIYIYCRRAWRTIVGKLHMVLGSLFSLDLNEWQEKIKVVPPSRAYILGIGLNCTVEAQVKVQKPTL